MYKAKIAKEQSLAKVEKWIKVTMKASPIDNDKGTTFRTAIEQKAESDTATEMYVVQDYAQIYCAISSDLSPLFFRISEQRVSFTTPKIATKIAAYYYCHYFLGRGRRIYRTWPPL